MKNIRPAVLSITAACLAPTLVYLGYRLAARMDPDTTTGMVIYRVSMLAAVIAAITAIIYGVMAIARRDGRSLAIPAVVVSVIEFLLAGFVQFYAMAGGGGPHGRPLRLRGRQRLTPVEDGADWQAPIAKAELELSIAER